ncbi:MAG: ATP-binding protein, partial [Caldilineaceae bacterium]
DRDITEQMLSEMETQRLLDNVQAQASQMQMLIDSTPEAILLLDNEFRLLIFNPAAQTAIGVHTTLTPGSYLHRLGNQSLTQLLPADGEEVSQEISHELRMGDDPVITYDMTIRAIHSRDTKLGWLLTLRNVTLSRQRQEQEEQQARLAAVGQLAAGIAHDFNNILGSISLLVQLAESDPQISARGRGHLATAIEQVEHAASLIRQILDFGRKSVMSRTTRDLADFLLDTCQLLQHILEDNIHVVFERPPGDFCFCADYTLLQQVCLNLGINARDAMPNGGQLSFDLSRFSADGASRGHQMGIPAGGWYCIAVHDTGKGISDEALPHIFEPFFTSKESGEGSGLGLAQVYGIIDQHQGLIRVDSTSGLGTTFYIYLPASDQKQEVYTDEPRPVPSVQTVGNQAILIVEDQVVLRDALCEILEIHGFAPVAVAGGSDAVALFAEDPQRFALVLSDMSMPEMNGVEMHQILRRFNPGVRTLILSGFSAQADQQAMEADGIVGWLQKPVDSGELVSSIQNVLNSIES